MQLSRNAIKLCYPRIFLERIECAHLSSLTLSFHFSYFPIHIFEYLWNFCQCWVSSLFP